MIKLFWIFWAGCSVVVFKHAITNSIKSEIDSWGEIDGETLIMLSVVSLVVSLFGPIAILCYLLYNIVEGIAEAISEVYNK